MSWGLPVSHVHETSLTLPESLDFRIGLHLEVEVDTYTAACLGLSSLFTLPPLLPTKLSPQGQE